MKSNECKYCKKTLEGKRSNAKYCSPTCKTNAFHARKYAGMSGVNEITHQPNMSSLTGSMNPLLSMFIQGLQNEAANAKEELKQANDKIEKLIEEKHRLEKEASVNEGLGSVEPSPSIKELLNPETVGAIGQIVGMFKGGNNNAPQPSNQSGFAMSIENMLQDKSDEFIEKFLAFTMLAVQSSPTFLDTILEYVNKIKSNQ